jgi:prephenate dehydratase
MAPQAELMEMPTFADAVAALADGSADLAVLPLRNMITGTIGPVAILLRDRQFRNVAKIVVDVDHVLAGTEGSSLETVREIVSHPEALKQCSRFLGKHPDVTTRPGPDTASAVRDVANCGDTSIAAISSRRAADIYGAVILCPNVSDQAGNWTVFGLYSR